MPEREDALSQSLEDYLEAIYNLKVRGQAARVKDIAQMMDVKMPSVTDAVRTLAARGLVKHQPYESIELTEEGLNRARSIQQSHGAVKEFLVSVLGLNEVDAETEACGVEHAIQPETLERLLKFVEFVRAAQDDKSLRLEHFQHYLEQGEYPKECTGDLPTRLRKGHRWGRFPAGPPVNYTRLSDLTPGTRGKVAFVSGRGPIRKRLMDMGVTSGAEFEVVRMAPLGDPIEIRIRGYSLSLRKSEAENVEVQIER